MALKDYVCSALIGGGVGALDTIDGANLTDGCAAKVIMSSGVYWYHLNATSGASENSPFRIVPDTNAGTKVWHLVGTTARIGALVKLSLDKTITTATNTSVVWDSASYDDANFWEGVTNPSRLSVPIGVTGVILKGNIRFEAIASNDVISISALKNSSFTYDGKPGVASETINSSSISSLLSFASSIIPVVGGTDYFELSIYQTSVGDLDVTAHSLTWFSIEAIVFE
jgi:hypothetical protein